MNLEHCPYCPDQGWYVSVDFNGEFREQIQCKFCYTTPNSYFNFNEMKKLKLRKLRKIGI